MNLKVDKALIKKYLKGSCNEEELILVREFLKEENAQELFNEVWDEEWASANNVAYPVTDPQQMTEWKNTIYQKINETASQQKDTTVTILKKIVTWKYAAVWATLIFGAGLWAMYLAKAPEKVTITFIEKSNPNGRRTIITLPDSSHVYLGAGSKLRYAEKFNTATRELSLEGEAFFDVTKNPKKPFIIHTGAITTKVLGTSFKVNAFLNQPVTVSVSTGKVRVDRYIGGKTESIAVLTPGQIVTWNEARHLGVLGKAAVADISGWKDGRLVFDETRLSEITAVLERWYAVKISFKNKKVASRLMKVNLTANVPINTLMKILAASGQFKFQLRDNHITII